MTNVESECIFGFKRVVGSETGNLEFITWLKRVDLSLNACFCGCLYVGIWKFVLSVCVSRCGRYYIFEVR